MTQIGLNWNYGYQSNMQTGALTYDQNQFNQHFITGQQQYMTGMGDPLEALNYGLGLIDQWSQPAPQPTFNNQQYSYAPQTGFNSPFSLPQAPAGSGLEGVMGMAAAETMMMMGMQMAIQQQLQGGMPITQDPLTMNKMMGARMEQIGGDLKDDGIINGSNQKPNMMQKMMQLMMMFMQMLMQMFGMGQQQQPQPQQYQQQQAINPSDPFAMNKMMGAQMERIGGDLKDDGMMNGSNMRPRPHRHHPKPPMGPMQMMMGMMTMFAGMDAMDNGQMDGSVFRQFAQQA